MSWEAIAKGKRERRAALLAETTASINQADADHALSVLGETFNLPSLMQRLSSGQVRSVDVVSLFLRRAAEAQQKTNCLTEILFDTALARARELDAYYDKTGRLVGPLHGMPMSVKDQFDIAGFDTTLGYIGRANNPASRDATLVALLTDLGAVFIAKTNIPQSILWCETENPLWGLTTSPFNPSLTPGGSSGGEAALIALGGSMCGWGTDIGGSIRIPSHLNGLFGLKPTSTRFPYRGVPVSHEGQEHVPSSIGPMAPDLETIVAVTRHALDKEPWIHDPKVTPLPWRENLYREIQSRPLRIGLILDDGVVRPHPEVAESVREAASLLRKAGHEIVPWDTSDHHECIRIMDRFYRVDGGKDLVHDISRAGEPMIDVVAALVADSKEMSIYDYWQLNRLKIAAQQKYNDKWSSTASSAGGDVVDVILSPVMPHTSVPHKSCRWVGYTKIWNFLDYTALSFPWTTFSSKSASETYAPRNPLDEHNHSLYDPALMEGLPIGVQIIGRRFQEEKVLGVAAVLQELRRGVLN